MVWTLDHYCCSENEAHLSVCLYLSLTLFPLLLFCLSPSLFFLFISVFLTVLSLPLSRPLSLQAEVCAGTVAEVIQSVVNGADGCVFCFGHSRLGKTHTHTHTHVLTHA